MKVHLADVAFTAGLMLCAGVVLAQDHTAHRPDGGASSRAAQSRKADAECPMHSTHVQPSPATGAAPSPYAGQQERTVKALSDEEIRGYLEGHGVGLARPAELNHYPGPRHVLDLADALGLTAAQTATAQRAYEQMHAAVLPLGERYVAQERRLDELFARAEIDETSLRAAVTEAARLQGELRFAHLGAHLAVREALTSEQVARYDQLRGY